MFSFWIVAQQAAPEGPGLISTLFPLLLIFFIFWFLVWRPQAKQQASHRDFLGRLKVGDEVVTGGGIFGRVTALEDDAVQLEISRGTKIRVMRQNIQGPQPRRATSSTDKSEEAAVDKADKGEAKDKRDKKSKKEASEGGW
jgi:preprotein translocase subunit YajC